MENSRPSKENMLFEMTEDDDAPQEVKDVLQKNIDINDPLEEKEVKIIAKKGESKDFKPDILIINCYWIEIIAKISLGFSLIIYEIIGVRLLRSLLQMFKGDFEDIIDSLSVIFQEIGLKWLFIINMCQDLSIGFFCLTNFSKILKETNRPVKFIITNLIKTILFYLLALFILKVMIEINIFEIIKNKVYITI